MRDETGQDRGNEHHEWCNSAEDECYATKRAPGPARPGALSLGGRGLRQAVLQGSPGFGTPSSRPPRVSGCFHSSPGGSAVGSTDTGMLYPVLSTAFRCWGNGIVGSHPCPRGASSMGSTG